MSTASLEPIATDRFGYAEARHLLNRAGFGGTGEQIQALAAMGCADAVDYLVDYERVDASGLAGPGLDPSVMRPLTRAERQELRTARRRNDEKTQAKFRAMRNQAQAADRVQLAELQRWWLDRMIRTPRPLAEKLTLLWHDHFATHYRGCEDAYLLYRQNRLFREHAAGNFAELVRGVVRDPAMLVFLNNDRNVKRKPNENLARELMELFTLGEGHYTERDIKEGARALTGYTRHDNDFRFDKAQHDEATKQVFGQRGNFDGDDLADLCLAQRACSEFVAFKVYGWFVADLADPEDADETQRRVITALGAALRRSRYELKPMLTVLLRSEHFYDAAVRGGKIKTPAELTVGLVRTLRTPRRDESLLLDAMKMMGQELFNPPNVSGFSVGRAWINTSTLFIRQNLATYLLTGRLPAIRDWRRDDIGYSPMPLVADLPRRTPEAVVDRLIGLLLGDAAAPGRREQLLRFLADHDNRISDDSLIALLCLITAAPEFQLC